MSYPPSFVRVLPHAVISSSALQEVLRRAGTAGTPHVSAPCKNRAFRNFCTSGQTSPVPHLAEHPARTQQLLPAFEPHEFRRTCSPGVLLGSRAYAILLHMCTTQSPSALLELPGNSTSSLPLPPLFYFFDYKKPAIGKRRALTILHCYVPRSAVPLSL